MNKEKTFSSLLMFLGSAASIQRQAQHTSRCLRHFTRIKPNNFQQHASITSPAFQHILSRTSIRSSSWLSPRLPSSITRSLSSASTPPAVARSESTSTSSATAGGETPSPERPPSYELTFTCKPCRHRSTHSVTKQGYHHGAVLITCPGCKNRHVISDHLGIFADKKFTVEDLMKQQGQLVKRGTLGEEGDIEFWHDDGTETPRVNEGA